MRTCTKSFIAVMLVAAGHFCVPGAGWAQTPSPNFQTPSPNVATPNIPEQKLDAAAAAAESVMRLKQNFTEQMAKAAPADRERIADDTKRALTNAITDQGLSIEEYTSILEVAQNDDTVRERILRRLQPPNKN